MKKILLALVAFATATFSALAGDIVVTNSGFESWTNNAPDSWAQEGTNATYEQTTDANTGSYAICIKGTKSTNKRLNSAAYKLKAGTYTMSAYVKGGNPKFAYVPYITGSGVNSGGYTYSDALGTNDEYTKVSYEFTLKSNTSIVLVICNSKSQDDLYADDVTLTTEDGGIDDTPDEAAPEAKGDGSFENPYNPIAASNIGKELGSGNTTEDSYYIKGIVSRVSSAYASNYGNGSFYISEDGEDKYSFYIYRALYLGNEKFTDSDTQIEVGDQVLIYGKITNYNGTPETPQGGAYLYSLNGITSVNNATVSINNGKVNMYSIDGRKVSKLSKGINIVNGKKVLVK